MTDDGLPFGAQVIATRLGDHALLDLLAWLEEHELLSPVEPVTPNITSQA
jgi:Asp-tRNA(Asn)/Glu-tRNA(Gln) amidotransferase A subunit family amidase